MEPSENKIMNTMTIASEESAFRTGLKEAGFVSSDFMVKYETAAAARKRQGNGNMTPVPNSVRVSRISNSAAFTFPGGNDISWAAAALAKVQAGLFGLK
jgi:hypothetical protein